MTDDQHAQIPAGTRPEDYPGYDWSPTGKTCGCGKRHPMAIGRQEYEMPPDPLWQQKRLMIVQGVLAMLRCYARTDRPGPVDDLFNDVPHGLRMYYTGFAAQVAYAELITAFGDNAPQALGALITTWKNGFSDLNTSDATPQQLAQSAALISVVEALAGEVLGAPPSEAIDISQGGGVPARVFTVFLIWLSVMVMMNNLDHDRAAVLAHIGEMADYMRAGPVGKPAPGD